MNKFAIFLLATLLISAYCYSTFETLQKLQLVGDGQEKTDQEQKIEFKLDEESEFDVDCDGDCHDRKIEKQQQEVQDKKDQDTETERTSNIEANKNLRKRQLLFGSYFDDDSENEEEDSEDEEEEQDVQQILEVHNVPQVQDVPDVPEVLDVPEVQDAPDVPQEVHEDASEVEDAPEVQDVLNVPEEVQDVEDVPEEVHEDAPDVPEEVHEDAPEIQDVLNVPDVQDVPGVQEAIPVQIDACQLQIGIKTKDINVNTNCHFETVDSAAFVISQASLKLNKISLDASCVSAYVTSVEYQSPIDDKWYSFDEKYVSLLSDDSLVAPQKISIPLIDVYNFSKPTPLGDEQITQVIHLRLKIGHENKVVRIHAWDLTVYTNRGQVQVFNIDVDFNIQHTGGCQNGQECIITADLDTIGKIKSDETFTTDKTSPFLYEVGDNFYAKITFADPTYTKRLQFDSLYFKSDQGKVFDFSAITAAFWDGTGLTITLPLVEPTLEATIQINMRITDQNKLRALKATTDVGVKNSFIATIVQKRNSPSITSNTSNSNSTTNSLRIIFFLINIITYVLIF